MPFRCGYSRSPQKALKGNVTAYVVVSEQMSEINLERLRDVMTICNPHQRDYSFGTVPVRPGHRCHDMFSARTHHRVMVLCALASLCVRPGKLDSRESCDVGSIRVNAGRIRWRGQSELVGLPVCFVEESMD